MLVQEFESFVEQINDRYEINWKTKRRQSEDWAMYRGNYRFGEFE